MDAINTVQLEMADKLLCQRAQKDNFSKHPRETDPTKPSLPVWFWTQFETETIYSLEVSHLIEEKELVPRGTFLIEHSK